MAKEIRLPDIGDFKDVPVIEILVAPGQSVRKDEPLLTLESDKASMDVPAPEDGVIGEIHVKVGDKLTQGDLLATYVGRNRGEAGCSAKGRRVVRAQSHGPGREGGGVEIQEPAPKAAAPAGPPPKPAPDPGGQADFEADILVLGRRSRRLHRRLPRRRSGAERRSGRTRDQRSAAFASTSAASRPRRCCMSPR